MNYTICSVIDIANTKGEQATLASMIGVFYILIAGVGLGITSVIFECVVAIHKDKKAILKRTVSETKRRVILDVLKMYSQLYKELYFWNIYIYMCVCVCMRV